MCCLERFFASGVDIYDSTKCSQPQTSFSLRSGIYFGRTICHHYAKFELELHSLVRGSDIILVFVANFVYILKWCALYFCLWMIICALSHLLSLEVDMEIAFKILVHLEEICCA